MSDWQAELVAIRSQQQTRTIANQLRFQLLAMANGLGEVTSYKQESWASLTMAGKRHELEIEFCGAEACQAAEGLIADLAEHEFSISGQLVADASVRRVNHEFGGDGERLTLTCVCLLIEED